MHPCTRLCVLALTSAVVALPASQAFAGRYRFPSSDEDAQFFYPTAYVDHGGVDWNCGSLQYAGHSGSDFGGGSWEGMAAGRDVVAAADGVVSWAHDGEYDMCAGDCPDAGFGNVVYVRHVDGRQTVYGHLAKDSATVAEGDRVSCGQLLGRMGSSGNSTGPHLHFGVLELDQTWADPFAGDCSQATSSWVEQGEYELLPGLLCDEPPAACAAVETISCGAQIVANNTDPGSTDEHLFYGCDHDLLSSGNEIAWEVISDLDEPVTIDLTGLSADLDLYVLDSNACDTQGCVDVSRLGQSADETLVFDAVAGQPYLVVVDGFQDAVSDFVLSVSCEGQPPGDDETGTETGTETDTGMETDGGESSGETLGGLGEDPGLARGTDAGCACSSGGDTPGPSALVVVGLLGLFARRRR